MSNERYYIKERKDILVAFCHHTFVGFLLPHLLFIFSQISRCLKVQRSLFLLIPLNITYLYKMRTFNFYMISLGEIRLRFVVYSNIVLVTLKSK